MSEFERWGRWLAAALGLTDPGATARVMAIFVPLARRLQVRTGATPEQVARRILIVQARAGSARIGEIRRLARAQGVSGVFPRPERPPRPS